MKSLGKMTVLMGEGGKREEKNKRLIPGVVCKRGRDSTQHLLDGSLTEVAQQKHILTLPFMQALH